MTNNLRPGALFATALGAITLIGPLSIHLFLPVMPAVKTAFAISDALAELTFSVTLFTMAIVTLFYGSLSDRYGRRPVLLGGLALFIIGSALSAFALSVAMLIAGRVIQAIGAGCGLTLSRAIARDAYGPEALVKAIAYLTMAYTIGPLIAPTFGGVLMDIFGWRAAFWFALLSGIGILIVSYVALFETRHRSGAPARQAPVLAQYASLLGSARFVAYALQPGAMSFGFFAIAAASPLLTKDLLGMGGVAYGLYFMMFPIGYTSGNWISVRLSGRVPVDTMVLLGSILAFLIFVGQAALILAGNLSPLLIFLPGGLVSFAQGISMPNAQAGAMRIEPTLAGTAAGLGVFMQMFLPALSSELFGILSDGTALPMIELTMIGATVALGAAIASYIFGRRTVVPA
ncbi:MAG TPA: multidrug effflux MFS transporter [Stellaceae bacterium]|jgi:DHA1 family bicyclomycin/chloramphenicol resistance-like MFS transporter|nr:multidrug effflux MFS transporter [Stellaceae bacterium]